VRYLLKTRREIVYEASKGYKKLYKKEKIERLDNLVAITGYNRDHICDYSPSMIGVFM